MAKLKLVTSAAASKSHLRDSMNRLKSIRKRTGKDDDDQEMKESSGDPFRDKATQFGKDIAECKTMIIERNDGAAKMGQDSHTIEQSHDINRSLHQLDSDLIQIKTMVEKTERELGKANKKGKAQSKILLLEQQLRGRQTTYEMCAELLKGAKEMNDKRFGGGQNVVKKGKKGATNPNVQIGKKMLMRQQLLDLSKPRAEEALGNNGGGGDVNLDEHPETAEQMKVLKAQDQKINQGLDRLSKGIGRLHEVAVQIGIEIDTQNAAIDALDENVDNQTKNLKQLNKRLKGLVAKSKPMNMFMNIGCFILLLSLVGYFLYEFGVV